jgi:hypothetical protein
VRNVCLCGTSKENEANFILKGFVLIDMYFGHKNTMRIRSYSLTFNKRYQKDSYKHKYLFYILLLKVVAKVLANHQYNIIMNCISFCFVPGIETAYQYGTDNIMNVINANKQKWLRRSEAINVFSY